MSNTIYYSNQAQKYLLRLTPAKTKSVLTRLKFIAESPTKPDNNIVKLVGSKSSYRLRIGNIRVIYYLDVEKTSIYVVKIAPRGSAYSS
jgi:mRNA-degrading endonuclease RelE of RelBE toxin-antitoxin system